MESVNPTTLNPQPTTTLPVDDIRIIPEDDSMQPHTDPTFVVETKEDDDVLAKHVTQLAALIKRSKSVVVMIGAGVSTSTGIPDYRGPSGKWTLVQRLQTALNDEEREAVQQEIIEGNKRYQVQAEGGRPSLSHLALKALVEAGHIKMVISTNIDGLHRASGLHPRNLAELHGNSRRARCNTCLKYASSADRFLSAEDGNDNPYDVHGNTIHTLGPCPLTPQCAGKLQDTIVHFGESLAPEVQEAADTASEDVDCLLCIGTSLRIISCSALMHVGTNQGKFVIVNLQKTEYDGLAKLRIFHDCDTVLGRLAAALNVPIPTFTIVRRFNITFDLKRRTIQFTGKDEVEEPCVFVAKMELVDTTDGSSVDDVVLHSVQTESNLVNCIASGNNPWAPLELSLSAATQDSASLETSPLVVRWYSWGGKEEGNSRYPPCDVSLRLLVANREEGDDHVTKSFVASRHGDAPPSTPWMVKLIE